MPNNFDPDTIYAALYRRDDGRYHWAFVLAQGPSDGYKFHATNIPDHTKWHYEQEVYTLDREKKPLILMAKLGRKPADIPYTHVENILREVPMDSETPQPDIPQTFTCRIWFREGVHRMCAAGLIQCLSVDALERELLDIADDHSNLVALGLRPWKLFEDLLSSH